jgi:hypothetical protein
MNSTKICPPDKVLNPASSRCVSRTSKLGISILQQQPAPNKQQQPQPEPKQYKQQQKTTKTCPPDKVLNPASSRCVSRTSKLGISILQQQPDPNRQQQQQPAPRQQKQNKTIKICPPDKVLNPASSRCVSRTSKLGISILQKQPSPSPSSTPPSSLSSPSPSPSHSHIQRSTTSSRSLKRRKASVILRFMRKTKHARKANFLNAVCSDSGVCIAFGTQSEEIKKFFNGFSEFDYVESFIKGNTDSANGFIYAINYKHRGYSANAILKSSASPSADNLMYEYIVGKRINELFYTKFPIFVETYDYYYKYPTEAVWKSFKTGMYGGKLKGALIPYTNVNYKMSCTHTKHLCILIQNINKAPTLNKMCESIVYIRNELINTLYQIYFSLSAIRNVFTHYDLHASNVLVYTPDPTKYIQYHFHLITGEIVTFKSQHLIKIIDYGRSYAKDASEEVHEKVCAENKCDPNCGFSYGYWMSKNTSYFIKSWKCNNSHDLKLLNIIKGDLAHIPKPANSIESLIHKKLQTVIYSEMYGTAEIKQTRQPLRIANVSDAEMSLRTLINSALFRTTNETYMNRYAKMGDLTVYADGRDMVYQAV